MLTPSPNGARWPEPQPLANPGRFTHLHPAHRPHQLGAGTGLVSDGTQFATASGDGTARTWNVTLDATFTDVGDNLVAAAWSPDGKCVATAGGDTPEIWDLTSEHPTTPVIRCIGRISTLSWSPDCRYLVTGSSRTIRIWDIRAGCDLRASKTDAGDIRTIAWSPDGSLIATAGDDQTVRLWQFATRWWNGRPKIRIVSTLAGHTDWVFTVAWSPDGTRLATGGFDRTIRLWEPDTGAPIATLIGHPSPSSP